MTSRRETLTIVVMDVVGSSQLQSDHLKARLNAEIGSLLQSLTAKHHATLSKHKGDGFIAGGHDPVEMAELALETRHYFRTRNWKELGFLDRSQIRIALNTGTIEVLDDGEFSGKHVELACRIEPVVPPDSIWCSASTASFIREETGRIAVSDLGERELAKNSGTASLKALSWTHEVSPDQPSPPLPRAEKSFAGGTVKPARAARNVNRLRWVLAVAVVALLVLEVYQRFEFPGASVKPGSFTAASSPVQAGGISVAVLPFLNLSGDPNQEFFSDGVTEEITSALARVKGLRVVARTSAFEFKGQNRDLRAVGQALGATNLLEGSVRREGNRIRVTAQLIRAGDGTHIWTDDYDRELTSVFAIQDDISQAIARALQVPLGLKAGETLVTSRSIEPESYQTYLRARALVRLRGPLEPGGPLTQAVALLEQVIARNPDYAPAWALLSYTHSLIPNYQVDNGGNNVPPESVLTPAEAAAHRAIELDPRNPGGYIALAYTQAPRRKWAEAEDLFKQALALDPNDPDALHEYSVLVLMHVGRLREALAVRKIITALEPLVPTFNFQTAQILILNGQNQAAIPYIQAAPATATNFLRARIYAQEGQYDAAADAILSYDTGRVSHELLDTAAKLLRTAPTRVTNPAGLPVFSDRLSFVYAYVGARDRIMEAPERDLVNGEFWSIPWYPEWAPLRRTERFKALARKAGLVDYWRARGWPDMCHPTGKDDFSCE